jgi:hypothetical protein
MIELTENQQEALCRPAATPMPVVNPRTREAFVLLRLEEYERLTRSAYDTGPWTDGERDLLRAEALESLGWAGMEAYQDDAL